MIEGVPHPKDETSRQLMEAILAGFQQLVAAEDPTVATNLCRAVYTEFLKELPAAQQLAHLSLITIDLANNHLEPDLPDEETTDAASQAPDLQNVAPAG